VALEEHVHYKLHLVKPFFIGILVELIFKLGSHCSEIEGVETLIACPDLKLFRVNASVASEDLRLKFLDVDHILGTGFYFTPTDHWVLARKLHATFVKVGKCRANQLNRCFKLSQTNAIVDVVPASF
jgi:hypothetical protein